MGEMENSPLPIRYDEGGAGAPTLVLLHGLGVNAAAWTGLIPLVEARWPGRWIAPDLRGHGQSTKFYEPEHYHPDIMASDVIDLMDHLKVEQAELMGYSMGSRIAISAVQTAGDRFRHVVFDDWQHRRRHGEAIER